MYIGLYVKYPLFLSDFNDATECMARKFTLVQLAAQSATPSIAVSGSAVLGVTSQDIGTDGLLGLLQPSQVKADLFLRTQ